MIWMDDGGLFFFKIIYNSMAYTSYMDVYFLELKMCLPIFFLWVRPDLIIGKIPTCRKIFQTSYLNQGISVRNLELKVEVFKTFFLLDF